MLVSQRFCTKVCFYQGINYKPINTYSRACKAESLSNNSSPNPKHPACAQQPKSKARKPQQKRKIRSQFLIIIKTSLLLYSRYLCKRFHLAEPIHAFPPANSHIRSTPGTGTTTKSAHQSRPSPRPTLASKETVVVSASILPLGPPWYPIARLSAVYLAAAAPQSESS